MKYTVNITTLFLAATMILNYDSFVDTRLGGETGKDHHRDLESSQDDGVYRWASSGGGWRGMVGLMAFGNVFAQAGLITESASMFTSLSTVSGGSWFSTQLFYSPEFLYKITGNTPDELRGFVLTWMNSYETFSRRISEVPECKAIFNGTDDPTLQESEFLCNVVVAYDGDWAQFVKEMMAEAGQAYGDTDLVTKKVNSDNRNNAFSETELYLQTALAPNSRIRSTNKGVFLGPVDSTNVGEIYSVPLCVQYSVTKDNSLYYSTDIGGTLELQISIEDNVTNDFNYPQRYDEFGLFPESDLNVLMDPIKDLTIKGRKMTTPFGSEPNVAQIASASSAIEGVYSPLNPSLFSQKLSVARNSVEGTAEKAAFDKIVDEIYTKPIFDDLSVCTQWPNECGEGDGRFVDGYVTDQATLALNIGQYQTRMNGDMSKILKVILTITNNYEFGPTGLILPYFNTTFNENVNPGDYLWPEQHDFPLPMISQQVFDQYMDIDSLAAITEPIDGLNVTTATVSAQTLENPRYHIKAGQRVEILILSLNSNIPTVILGKDAIEATKYPLADMARGIASSQELLRRVKAFME
ncbi:hypothetical protein FRACYDRAFT_233497 [Fragilariopsis cylindrus CCMP1102]|uniref:PLA2c domain-containing protein n=1 Tax=Fragilariopsis cylindrus CCMP1102 TaxID=635003 RepID=A0A1E7FYW0_9STRA|nr:hypothetical protein FRACYDRAFT_233497 [Fragilariopsis cylindrus CCMP1102]|eukprot:OEU23326.1 hypothetical protein FRACYDRAFT_233497 [Fragilariopsis cylindrus CCMP1102]